MKIAFVNTLFGKDTLGGAERTVHGIARTLQTQGWETCVIATQPQGPYAVEIFDDVKVHYVPVANTYRPYSGSSPGAVRRALWHGVDSYNPVQGHRIVEIIAAENVDLVSTHCLAGVSVAAWVAASKLDLPVVHFLHDYYLMCPKSSMQQGDVPCPFQCTTCRLSRWPARRLSKRIDSVCSVSQFVLERHRANGFFGGAEQQETVIYNSPVRRADISTAPPIRKDPGLLRIGYIGQIIPEKGLETLIDAARSLSALRWSLDIAGRAVSVAYQASLVERAGGDSRVRWLGMVHPDEFYPNIDLLVVPSLWHEPFGRVLVEAFARGVPVFAADRGGIPEVIGSSEAGLVFDPTDARALSALIDGIARDPNRHRRMSLAALERAHDFQAEFGDRAYSKLMADAVERRRFRRPRAR